MGKKVTALRFQKRNKDRVNVYLDGEFAFGLAAIEAAHLKVGQTLTPEEIAELKRKDEVERAYERALNYLSYRPRSTSEIRRNLWKKGIDEVVIDKVIERLERARLVDDLEFARYWIENREQFNPRGARALRHELREKGVSHSTINEALSDFDEQPSARKAAEAGARRLSHLEEEDFRRKLSGYLARRGFAYPIAKALVEKEWAAIENDAETGIESEGDIHG